MPQALVQLLLENDAQVDIQTLVRNLPNMNFRVDIKGMTSHIIFKTVSLAQFLISLFYIFLGWSDPGIAPNMSRRKPEASSWVFQRVLRNNRGDTAEDLARASGHHDLLQILCTFAV